MQQTTVAVVDDHPMYRRAVADLVEGAPDLDLVHVCGSVVELERALDVGPPVDVVVLDLSLPGVHGAEGVRRVAERGPRVLVLSDSPLDESTVPVLAAGAHGYVTKAADAEEIIVAVRTLARGESYLVAGAAAALLTAVQPAPAPVGPVLSVRESQVLTLLATGRTDSAIARELVIGVTTVRSHLDNIRAKSGRRRRAELTRLAYEVGLVADSR